jgi:pimeloyl-ACP methyl ester carboxylesterase
VKRRWKILIAIVAALAVLLAVNTIVVNDQTKGAEVTVEGGRILQLPGGDVQVVEEGPTAGGPRQSGPAIVLVHCSNCSLHWWDRIAPLLAERHRVIRIDLLGHGGSEKPSSGYSIEDQGALVAGALSQLDVEGAVVVGQSMGFSASVALATQASQLVDRLVNLDEGPDPDMCEFPFIARLGYTPVLGEASWRVAPDFAIKDGYEDAFAPGFDVESGFDDPDQVVDDFRAMTFTSFKDTHDANDDYRDEIPLDERVIQAAVPLLSIFGSEDQICDAEESQAAYETVPGARTEMIEGAGHSPNVEKPEETAALIEDFAAGVISPAGPNNKGK